METTNTSKQRFVVLQKQGSETDDFVLESMSVWKTLYKTPEEAKAAILQATAEWEAEMEIDCSNAPDEIEAAFRDFDGYSDIVVFVNPDLSYKVAVVDL